MAIKQVEYKNKKSGTRWHADKKKWIGYQIDVRAGKKRYRNNRFPTKKEAEDFIENLKLENTYKKAGLKYQKSLTEIRVSELFEKHALQIERRKARVFFDRVSKDFQSLLDYDLKVSEVRKAHFQLFINKRKADGVKDATIDREVTAIASPLNKASEMFPAELENFEPPRIIRPRYKRTPRSKVISEREKNLICEYLRQPRMEKERAETFRSRLEMEKMFHLAWLLGLRFGEIKNLKVKDFLESEKTLAVFRSKTNEWAILEFLPDEVIEILSAAVAESKTEFIFNLEISDPTFYKILERACAAGGIEYGADKLNGLTFHANRHSFTTRLVQVTDIATAASFTSHSNREMVAYYSHASAESKQRAMSALYSSQYISDSESENLRNIFEKVKNNEMNFDEFLEALDKKRPEAKVVKA